MSSELTFRPFVGPVPEDGRPIEVSVPDPDDEGACIELADVAAGLEQLEDADEIVIPAPRIELVIDYPIKSAVVFELAAAAPTGFTRAELVTRIGEIYAHIYRVEDETTTTPAGLVGATVNRTRTTGVFGVWGHVLEDLVLERLYVIEAPGAPTLVTLAVGS